MRFLTSLRSPSATRQPSTTAALRRGVVLPSVVLIALAGGVSACSGDDDSDGSGGSADPSSQGADGAGTDQAADEDSQGPGAQIGGCRVQVEATGDAEVSWKGKASVRTPGADDTGGGPAATYVAEKGKNQLSVYSAGESFDGPAVTFTSGKQTYASDPADQDAMTVEEDGSGAEVDLQLRGLDDRSAALNATFTCNEKAGKQGGKKGKNGKGGGKKGTNDKG